MTRLAMAVVAVLLLPACYTTIQDYDFTPESAQAFATRVKHIKVRVWFHQANRCVSHEADARIAATVTEVLQDKGYTVELVHDDPFTYGHRQDARPHYCGYVNRLLDDRFLGPSTAFIEVAYGLQLNEEYRVQTHTNQHEVGHIEDAHGNRIATEYATSTSEEEYVVEHPKAHADAEVFFGALTPAYGRFVSCPESRDMVDVTERALAGIPDAQRPDAEK